MLSLSSILLRSGFKCFRLVLDNTGRIIGGSWGWHIAIGVTSPASISYPLLSYQSLSILSGSAQQCSQGHRRVFHCGLVLIINGGWTGKYFNAMARRLSKQLYKEIFALHSSCKGYLGHWQRLTGKVLMVKYYKTGKV